MADDKTLMDGDSDLLLEIRDRYESGRTHASEWRTEARQSFDMYAGRQWSEQDTQKLTEQQRVPVTFNRTAILIDAVIGYEVNNRQETRYIPRTPGDAKVNELLSKSSNTGAIHADGIFQAYWGTPQGPDTSP